MVAYIFLLGCVAVGLASGAELPRAGAAVSYKDLALLTGTTKVAELGVELSGAVSGEHGADFPDDTTLRVRGMPSGCLRVEWSAAADKKLVDCFDLGAAHWYGGPERYEQLWPLEKYTWKEESMVTKEGGSHQAVADPFWFNSDGLAVHVERGVPLFIDQNNLKPNKLCLVAHLPADGPYRQRARNNLRYTVCKSADAREAFLQARQLFLGKPSGVPDRRMIQHPIWSTWARYKWPVNDSIVQQFADEILEHGFKNSQLEIDDFWETCYGSATPDPAKFPDFKATVQRLHDKGFRVTVWTHPFIQEDCVLAHACAKANGFFVENAAHNTTSEWWNGWAGTIDFTNPDAAEWWAKRQHSLMNDFGVDGLKFDAGESSYTPLPRPVLNIPGGVFEDYPNHFSGEYIKLVGSFGGLTEYRTAYRAQTLPTFLRMQDKDSKWGYDNGLKTLVTTLLQLNSVGYSIVLPDMVGGNEYLEDRADGELMVRWAQANTFMPAIQYSLVPWQFGEQVTQICRKYADLHATYTDQIMSLMELNVKDGTPVNPPVWWIAPHDEEAQKIDSEYMLGDSILVAPVLEKGAVKRDIYLPAGTWLDEGSSPGKKYSGPIWLKEYPAPLEVLPYFVRQRDASGGNGGHGLTALRGLCPMLLAALVLL